MKNRVILTAIISCMIFLSACSGGMVVTDRPADVVYERPLSPGDGYIWLDGDWYWSGGRYQWRAGHWDRPRTGRNWSAGHWQSAGHGWKWQRGHWHK